MSFRLFVFYCAVGGAWSGFIGWILGRLLAPAVHEGYFSHVLHDSIIGLLLGFAVAFGLSLLDAIFSVSLRRFGKVFVRVSAAIFIGVFGGLFGSFIGGSLYYAAAQSPDSWPTSLKNVLMGTAGILGWTLVGLLIGLSIAFFEVLASLLTRKDFAGAVKKVLKCVVGGTIGGIIGGCIALGFGSLAGKVISKDPGILLAPTAFGFVAIGACIGLLVGLAQIILKEAWIRVEAGFRPGREMIISKEKTSIGRAEGSDIALFGDSAVEKTHAFIVLDGGRYYLEDQSTPNGTFVNDQKVNGRMALRAGDLIRVGKSVIRFNERAKRRD